MNLLSKISIIRQQHPDIGPQQPFSLASEYRHGKDEVFHGDMHYALQFCIVIHGSMEVMFEGFQREFLPGDVWWTMFWEPHAFRFTGTRNFALAVNVDINCLGDCDPFGSGDSLLPFVASPEQRYCPGSKKEREWFRENGRKLFHQWTGRPANWKLYSWFGIHEMILRSIDGMKEDRANLSKIEVTEKFRKIRPAVNLVNNTSGRPPLLSEAAAACNLSVSRFSDIFRQTFGVSFGKFAARARLAAAARELKQSYLAIEEIAANWGFYDCSHFHHAFRELYGCTPKQYQKNN